MSNPEICPQQSPVEYVKVNIGLEKLSNFLSSGPVEEA